MRRTCVWMTASKELTLLLWCGHFQRQQWEYLCYVSVSSVPYHMGGRGGQSVNPPSSVHSGDLQKTYHRRGGGIGPVIPRRTALTCRVQATWELELDHISHLGQTDHLQINHDLDHLEILTCYYETLCRVCTVHIQPGKHVLLYVMETTRLPPGNMSCIVQIIQIRNI